MAEYVERRNDGYYVGNSRVSLASIVYEFKDGDPPEIIRRNFPTLSLAGVWFHRFFSGSPGRS